MRGDVSYSTYSACRWTNPPDILEWNGDAICGKDNNNGDKLKTRRAYLLMLQRALSEAPRMVPVTNGWTEMDTNGRTRWQAR
jgi:hypothetical protein